MKLRNMAVLLMGVFFMWCAPGWADIEQMKVYKEAFPGSKPKCIDCHTDAIPKKDDGKHDLNDYGQKVKAAAEKPTAETYKSAGEAESK